MLGRILKQYTLNTYNNDDPNKPVYLAGLWIGRDIKQFAETINQFVSKVYIEDDEIIFIKNRKDDEFYTLHIGDYIVIDSHFHVFPLSTKTFNYLFKEINDECNNG